VIDDLAQYLLYLTGGAFAAGWLVAKIGAFLGRRWSSAKRDPRDDRIRSIEAELRVTGVSREKLLQELEASKKELSASEARMKEHAATIKEQLAEINKLRVDLKASVRKTDELRNELSDRAEENLRSTCRLRDIETELSVARASTDLMSTGVLDYNIDEDDQEEAAQIIKSVS